MFAVRRALRRGVNASSLQLLAQQPRALGGALAPRLAAALRAKSTAADINAKWAPDGDLAIKAIEKKTSTSAEALSEALVADHSWRQSNHIWSEEELSSVTLSEHKPACFSDHVMRGIMRTMYLGFNFVTRYDAKDPSEQAVAWRLIILESFAGVPGFVAAAFRHFYSLRTLKRDHGSIYTFLEEAENERMHLLVCLKVFEASSVTRAIVIFTQVSMTPFLILTYLIKPGAMHRFVGYLEETACLTYQNLIDKANEPGSKLHAAWSDIPAPPIAKSYWKLSSDATWIDTLRHILADESHHRDVNHTFATLPPGSDNPFIKKHMGDFDRHAVDRITALLKKEANIK